MRVEKVDSASPTASVWWIHADSGFSANRLAACLIQLAVSPMCEICYGDNDEDCSRVVKFIFRKLARPASSVKILQQLIDTGRC